MIILMACLIFSEAMAQDVTVMAFNVRVNVDGFPNDWNTRQWRAINMLKLYPADVIGLQEDEWVHVNSIMQNIPGMRMATEVSTGIMYQSNKLRVIQTGKFWLSNTPDAPNGSFDWGQLYIRRVQWAIFENIADGKRFYVYNNHWDIVGGFARLKSAQLLASRIASRQFPQYPFVITGDMNAPEVEESMVYLRNGGPVKTRDTFRDLYPTATNVGTFHGFGGGTGGPKIDFIMLQQGIGTTISSEIVRYNENRLYLTDHFPVIARLNIGGGTPPPPAEQKPFSGTAIKLPGVIEAENFDTGGQNVAYNDAGVGNNGNAYRNESVDLEVCSEGGHNVGWTETGEWLEYSVDVTESASYTLDARVAASGSTASMQVELDGVAISPVLAVPNTTGWQVWQTISKSGIPLTAGTKVLRIRIVSGGFNLNKIEFKKEVVTPPGNQAPFTGVSMKIPGTVEAENFDTGGQGVAFNDLTASNSGTAFRNEGVDLEVCAEGGFNVGWMEAGEWLEYTVEVLETATYTLDARIASTATTGSIQLELNNQAITQALSVPSTAGWQNWQTLSKTGIALNAGTYVLRVKVLAGPFNLNRLIFKKETATPLGCVGSYGNDYRYTVSAESANPTITFTPVLSGVGSSMLILYYGTGSGSLPGYRVNPNVPFRLNASAGQTIRFYYTYSHPAGGERNSSAAPHAVTVGSCGSAVTRIAFSEEETTFEKAGVYPNPMGASTQLFFKEEGVFSSLKIVNTSGIVVMEKNNWDASESLDLESLSQGVYQIIGDKDGELTVYRFVK
jgi:endonuclease/exonuclease/phosphatase family metal-dependent hydrolase